MTKQSHIEQLIHDLCPNGVEIKTLGELVDCVKGKQLNRSDLLSAGYPVLNGGTTYSGYWTEYNFPGNNITISQGGASAGFVSFQERKFWAGAHCYVLINPRPNVNYKYLYHIIKLSEDMLRQSQYGAGIPGLPLQVVNSIQIPLPPVSIQNEIVCMLDTMANLTQNIEQEIGTRQLQYYFVRQSLFANERSKWGLKTLGDICLIKTGSKPADIKTNGLYKYINAGTSASGYCDSSNCEGDVVTTPSRGQGGIGFVGYQKENFWLGPLCYQIRALQANAVSNKFIYYYLITHNEEILKFKCEGGTPALNAQDLKRINIYLPSLKEQQAIAAKLDTIEAFIANLNEERTLRQQQYEYYRAKLISLLK